MAISGFYLREISSIKVCTPAEEEAIALKACGNQYKYCKKIVCRCPKQIDPYKWTLESVSIMMIDRSLMNRCNIGVSTSPKRDRRWRPVSAKQAGEQEVGIKSLFCQGASPQAEKRGRAEPGFSIPVTRDLRCSLPHLALWHLLAVGPQGITRLPSDIALRPAWNYSEVTKRL